MQVLCIAGVACVYSLPALAKDTSIDQLAKQPSYAAFVQATELDASQEKIFRAYLKDNPDLLTKLIEMMQSNNSGAVSQPIVNAYGVVLDQLNKFTSTDKNQILLTEKLRKNSTKFAAMLTPHAEAIIEIFNSKNPMQHKVDVENFMTEKLRLVKLDPVLPSDFYYTPIGERFCYRNSVADVLIGSKKLEKVYQSQKGVYLFKPASFSKKRFPDRYDTPALVHPRIAFFLKTFFDHKKDVLIDNFLFYSGSAFYDDRGFMVVSPQSPFHVFIHEYRHFEYELALESAKKALLKEGNAAFWWLVQENGINRLTKAHIQANDSILKKFKTQYPLYYSILNRAHEIFDAGIKDEHTINEVIATEQQLVEMKKSGIGVNHQDFIRAHRYKLVAEIDYLQKLKQEDKSSTKEQDALLEKLEKENKRLIALQSNLPRTKVNSLSTDLIDRE